MKKEQNKIVLKGLLRFLLATFFCLVLMIFWVVFHDKARISNDLIFGLCFILILGMVFGDYGLKISEKMKNQVKFHGVEDCKKLFNVFFYPIFDLFLTSAEYQIIDDKSILILSSIPLYSFIVLVLLPLVMPIACQIGYSIGYNNIDVKAKLFYKNKNNI